MADIQEQGLNERITLYEGSTLDGRSTLLTIASIDDAWRPLYQTLTLDQRRRLAHVEMIALR